MKTKFLFAALAATITLGVLTPTSASARDCETGGYYVTQVVGYDHCGRPVYRQVWVSTGYPHSSHGHGHGSSHGSSHGGHNHGGGSSHGGGFIHAPGIDIHFGGSHSGHRHGH